MKPDAWRFSFPTSDKWHLTEVPPNSYSRPNLTWEPLYSAATIRKWLLDEPSEDMQYAYHNGPMSPRFQWRERYMNMIAAKLQELEQEK